MIDGTNPTLGDARLDRLVAEVLSERAEDVSAAALTSRDMTDRIIGSPRFAWPRQGSRLGPMGSLALLAVLALLVIAALAVTLVGAGRLPRNRLSVPAAQLAVIEAQVKAINARDTDAFIATFIPEGVFGPGGDFRESSSLFANSLPLADASLVAAWMAINDAWGLEAEIVACNQHPNAEISYGYGEGRGDPMVVDCDVTTRRTALSMEITERWTYEFHGSGLGHLAFDPVDLNPPDRTLPLGYDGLEAWEAWLAATDPGSAARYLNPRAAPACDGCSDHLRSTATHDWQIRGHDFAPHGLVPYDPAFVDGIRASIQAYLDRR